jgi:hypothetical protein
MKMRTLGKTTGVAAGALALLYLAHGMLLRSLERLQKEADERMVETEWDLSDAKERLARAKVEQAEALAAHEQAKEQMAADHAAETAALEALRARLDASTDQVERDEILQEITDRCDQIFHRLVPSYVGERAATDAPTNSCDQQPLGLDRS